MTNEAGPCREQFPQARRRSDPVPRRRGAPRYLHGPEHRRRCRRVSGLELHVARLVAHSRWCVRVDRPRRHPPAPPPQAGPRGSSRLMSKPAFRGSHRLVERSLVGAGPIVHAGRRSPQRSPMQQRGSHPAFEDTRQSRIGRNVGDAAGKFGPVSAWSPIRQELRCPPTGAATRSSAP
jgi:hypothetical protein